MKEDFDLIIPTKTFQKINLQSIPLNPEKAHNGKIRRKLKMVPGNLRLAQKRHPKKMARSRSPTNQSPSTRELISYLAMPY